jgi:uncharacterized protein YoaH (UPF0181 family)
MTPHLYFLQDNLEVTPLDSDQVQITVTIPADYLFQFSQLIDCLSGFVQVLQRQEKISRSKKTYDSEEFRKEAQENIQHYYQRISKSFDHYISQGLDRNNAIKQIAAELRAEEHPWSSPDLVRPSLIKAGRPGRVGRPRRQP